jgi:ribonuclease VapC
MFVDASAIVAILTREPKADALADLLETARSPITPPIAIFEAALGICRKRHASVDEAEQDFGEFLEIAGVRTAPATDRKRTPHRRLFPATVKAGGIRRSSTSATALLTPWQETQGPRCCSRAMISTRPASAPQFRRD